MFQVSGIFVVPAAGNDDDDDCDCCGGPRIATLGEWELAADRGDVTGVGMDDFRAICGEYLFGATGDAGGGLKMGGTGVPKLEVRCFDEGEANTSSYDFRATRGAGFCG